jgi:hypothetical protein
MVEEADSAEVSAEGCEECLIRSEVGQHLVDH